MRPMAPQIRICCLTAALTTAVVMSACTEHLPMGPSAFLATVTITALPDTIVVGDTKVVSAVATDEAGNRVAALTYLWAVGDTGVLGLGTSDSASGRTRTLAARRPGVSSVTLRLPDTRFVTSPAIRNVTAVIARLQLTTARDTTMTAIGDTLMVRASGYIKSGATTVARPLAGLTWSLRAHNATSILAVGDSARAIAVGNGVDTIIIGHPYCLAGARCADTAVVRVTQSLRVALASSTLKAWSVGDTVSTSATVKDRRGLGQAGTFLKFFPKAAADSAIVNVTPLFGLNQPASGSMAVSRFVAKANGTATVIVQAFNAANALIDTTSLTLVVRQLAVRSTVFPLVSTVTHGDSIPLRARVIDARGNLIADATVALMPVSGTLSGFWAIGQAPTSVATQRVWADVAGAALAANNTGAPAVMMARDTAAVQSLPSMSVVAGSDSAAKVVSATALTYGAATLANAWVRFIPSAGVTTADSALTNGSGIAQVTWTLPTTAGSYRFTALQRQGLVPPLTATDSAGLILARRTVLVVADEPSAVMSAVSVVAGPYARATGYTITVNLKDAFGNPFGQATPTSFTATASVGSLGPFSCTGATCTATYTTPNAAAPGATISIQIGGVDLGGSPMAIIVP